MAAGNRIPKRESSGPRFAVGFRSASVACLSALSAGFGGKLRGLREAARLLRYAVPAVAAGRGAKRAILREAALRAWHALPTFAACLSGKSPILRETTLLVGHGLTAH